MTWLNCCDAITLSVMLLISKNGVNNIKVVDMPNYCVGLKFLCVFSAVQLSHLVVCILYEFGLRPLSTKNPVNL